MKRIVLLIMMTIWATVPMLAQYSPCYESAFAEGQKYYKAGKYNPRSYFKAKQCFEEAKGCPDPNLIAVDSMIRKCNEKIVEYNDNKKREDAEQHAREVEEERQRARARSMAKKGYMDIQGIYFENVGYDNRIIPQEGHVLYDENLRYIRPVVKYTALDTICDTVNLCVKMINQDGELLTDKSSYDDFSYRYRTVIEPDNDTLWLRPWGNGTNKYYSPGEYGFELWISDTDTDSCYKLLPSLFHVEKAPSKQILVDINCADSDSKIIIDGDYKGQHSWKGRLPIGQHSIICRKEGHKDSQKTISLIEGMGEQTIPLPSLEPLYGSLHITSDPISTQLYVDGEIQKNKSGTQTTSPFHINGVLVGKHEVRLEKKGYKNYVETVNVKANETYEITVPMTIQRTFGSFFMDFVTGDFIHEDKMLGGHVAICPKRVGAYGQFLYGMDYNSYQATGGVVFRLTSYYVDFQLYTGAGYGRFRSSQMSNNASFLMDFGGRLGWMTRTKWAMWDLMGGCSVTPHGDLYPYIGVGTGFSLSGAVTILALWASGVF